MALTRALTSTDHPDVLPLYDVLDGASRDPAAYHAILDHPGTTIFGSFDGARLCAMVTLHILPNMTQGGRPYALIENVVTHAEHRGVGHGRQVMEAAVSAAWAADCYKIMLLTGRTAQARGFYEALGFSADEKWGMTLRRAPLRQS